MYNQAGWNRSAVIGRAKQLAAAVAAAGLVATSVGVGVLSTPSRADAVVTAMVPLGTASTYAALTALSVGNTASAVGAPFTTLRGDLGVSSAGAITGFPPGVVTGTIRQSTGSAALGAEADLGPHTPTPLDGPPPIRSPVISPARHSCRASITLRRRSPTPASSR